jgi:hypothetical protein
LASTLVLPDFGQPAGIRHLVVSQALGFQSVAGLARPLLTGSAWIRTPNIWLTFPIAGAVPLNGLRGMSPTAAKCAC